MDLVPRFQQSFAVSMVGPVRGLCGAVAVGVGRFCRKFEGEIDA